MKALTKTILFGRITIERRTQLWPIGVFANPTSAKTYAMYLKMAVSSGNADLVKALDPQAKIDANGHVIPGLKLSVSTIPYEPSPTATMLDGDVADETPKPPVADSPASDSGSSETTSEPATT